MMMMMMRMIYVPGGGWFPMTGEAFPILHNGGTRVPVLPRGLLPLLCPKVGTDDGVEWSQWSPTKGPAEGGRGSTH